MLESITLARPYAKALFELALASNQLSDWSKWLTALSTAVTDPQTIRFFSNPDTSDELRHELLLSVLSPIMDAQDKPVIDSTIHLLLKNKRVLSLPAMACEFERLRNAYEKKITVQVSTFLPLSDTQQKQLIHSLSQRLDREVTLSITLDPALLGGAVIRAGDFVIDGSVRTQLNKLGSQLAA